MVYVAITFIALIFLNIYCSIACQRLFYDSKKKGLTDKAEIAAAAMGKVDELTYDAVSTIVTNTSSLRVTRLVVTDASGNIIYDTNTSNPQAVVMTEEMERALNQEDAFTWEFLSGIMISRAANTISSNGEVVGCIYLVEEDAQQGHLLMTLQTTILTTTLVLELVVILFSLAFAHTSSKRLGQIMTSMRIVQEGDFSHKIAMNGNDELTVLAEEFNHLSERLQTSEHKRQQFVSDASHELKTPLASIKLLAETILQNDMDMETIREFVGDIGDEAERLNRMSQKLLDLTRGESVEPIEKEIIYMSPMVERVCRMLSAHAVQAQVEIITQLENDVPILIREDDFYRILFNLMENGIKYNSPGGKLTVTLDHAEEWGILKVSDTGMGIPEDAISHIYERFYRVDKARSRASGGSGLGLSIVRNMVQRNQGQIDVESTFGMGTTFTVKFKSVQTTQEEHNE